MYWNWCPSRCPCSFLGPPSLYRRTFKRLEVCARISLITKMAEVLVRIVIELLSNLSIATKEVKRRRENELSQQDTLHISPISCFPELLSTNLLGRTDIEDTLKRLDSLIQEEVQMAIARILKVNTEIKDGTRPYRPVTNVALNASPHRCRQNQHGYAAEDSVTTTEAIRVGYHRHFTPHRSTSAQR